MTCEPSGNIQVRPVGSHSIGAGQGNEVNAA